MKKLLLLAIGISFINLTPQAQNALDFDGSNDYVQTTFPGVLGTTSRTFEAWIYVSSGLSSNNCIMDYGANAVGSRNSFSVNSNFQLIYISGGTNANISSSNNAVTPNQWTHVAFVLDNGTGYFYANGVQVGTGNLSTVNTPSGNTNLRIGQRVPGGSIPFDGLIDEVRVWNVARSAADITSSMNGEYCANPTGLLAYYKLNHGTAGGSNTGVTTAIDGVSANNGTLTNFALTGATSNWVLGKSLTVGGSDSATVVACDSFTSPSGNYTWTTTGNYIDTATSANGCDSVIYVDLTIKASSNGSLTTTACNSYTSPSGNNTWTTSGVYTDVLPNAVGCDSTITINLTVNTVDTNVLVNNATLTSWQTGANYQWLDCDNGYSAVSGATGQSFTPSANGNYAVQVELNGCTDTSSCYAIGGIGLDEFVLNSLFVFPNPSQPNQGIQLHYDIMLEGCSFEIYSLSGAVLQRGELFGSGEQTLDLALPVGTYFLAIKYAERILQTKLVIH